MIWGAICSVASSIGGAICSAVSSIGSGLTSFVSNIAPTLANIIDAIKPIAKAIGEFANAFLQGLDILKPDEKLEDIGERALQAAQKGITLDKFDNFEGYMDALRKFDVDPEIAARRSPTERIVAGLGVGTIGVEDKFQAERGSLSGLWLLPIANPEYFTAERMQSLVSSGRLGGDIYAYLEKRLSGGESRSIEKNLEVDANGTPLSETELDKLYGALDSTRDNWANLAKKVDAHLNSQQGA